MNQSAAATILEALDPTLRPVVIATVLLDPAGAADILANDKGHGVALAKAARQLVAVDPDVRIPLLATLLRGLLAQGDRSGGGMT